MFIKFDTARYVVSVFKIKFESIDGSCTFKNVILELSLAYYMYIGKDSSDALLVLLRHRCTGDPPNLNVLCL